ncbi:energy transducer TonB [Mucilaginibacter myungsuensis]|nr:energy transducer TonB [Mucilaginibacter myungsuensis]
MAPTHIPVWKKWLSAALVLIGINVMNNQAHAQGVPLKAKHIVIDDKKATTDEEIFTGFIAGPKYNKMPEFPGGEKAMFSYLPKHLNFKKGQKQGKVYAAFDVAKDGSLTNFKILRSLSPKLDNDVINALKASPKWKPAILKGKPVAFSSYVIPVNFSKD